MIPPELFLIVDRAVYDSITVKPKNHKPEVENSLARVSLTKIFENLFAVTILVYSFFTNT